MKKIIISLSFLSISLLNYASENKTDLVSTQTEVAKDSSIIEANILLLARLEEIKTIDKSQLSYKEKQALRKEVKSIDKTMKENSGGGIYFSAGAIIVILLVLILIL